MIALCEQRQTPHQQERPREWLVTAPKGRSFQACLTQACRGHEKIAVLLSCLLYEAYWKARREQINRAEADSIVLTGKTLDDFLRILRERKGCQVSKKTLIVWMHVLNDWGYVQSNGYKRIYRVYFKKIEAAFTNPPPADPPRPRGRAARCHQNAGEMPDQTALVTLSGFHREQESPSAWTNDGGAAMGQEDSSPAHESGVPTTGPLSMEDGPVAACACPFQGLVSHYQHEMNRLTHEINRLTHEMERMVSLLQSQMEPLPSLQVAQTARRATSDTFSVDLFKTREEQETRTEQEKKSDALCSAEIVPFSPVQEGMQEGREESRVPDGSNRVTGAASDDPVRPIAASETPSKKKKNRQGRQQAITGIEPPSPLPEPDLSSLSELEQRVYASLSEKDRVAYLLFDLQERGVYNAFLGTMGYKVPVPIGEGVKNAVRQLKAVAPSTEDFKHCSQYVHAQEQKKRPEKRFYHGRSLKLWDYVREWAEWKGALELAAQHQEEQTPDITQMTQEERKVFLTTLKKEHSMLSVWMMTYFGGDAGLADRKAIMAQRRAHPERQTVID